MHSNPTNDRSGEVTRLLAEASHGNRAAVDELFPLVYDELKALGRAKLRMERSGHTLNATALVHEAYIKLVTHESLAWQGRAHFFGVASLCMRRILVSHARARLSQKRGLGESPVPLDDDLVLLEGEDLFSTDEAAELVALDEALEQLHAFNPRGAEVVLHRFFGGLSHREIAEVSGVSEVTVRRRWTAAKSWLRSRLDPQQIERTQTLLIPVERSPTS